MGARKIGLRATPWKRIKQRRSIIDLVPTLLDLMRVDKGEPKGDFDFLAAASLVPDMVAATGASLPQRDVFVDMPAGPFHEARRAFIHDDTKPAIARGVPYQMLDLATAPEEKSALSDDKPKRKEARDRYDAFHARLKDMPLKPPP